MTEESKRRTRDYLPGGSDCQQGVKVVVNRQGKLDRLRYLKDKISVLVRKVR